MMKLTRFLFLCALLQTAPASNAALFSTPGGSINIPNGLHFEIASVFHNVFPAVGQEVSGVGEVNVINGVPTASLCSSACELTFSFSGYTITTRSPTFVTANGGTWTYYLGFGVDNDFNPATNPNSGAAIGAATNGAVFLNLVGHPVDALVVLC